VVLAAKVDGVHIHTAVISPVVGQSHDELDANFLSGLDNLVEAADVNGGRSIGVEPLEDNLGRPGALAAILGQATRDVGAVLVIEPPSAENREAGLLGRFQALLNVLLVLNHSQVALAILYRRPRTSCLFTDPIERKVVSVASGEVEILISQLKLLSIDGDELGVLGGAAMVTTTGGSRSRDGQQAGDEELRRNVHDDGLDDVGARAAGRNKLNNKLP
jgi:hypothetical protein